MTRLNLAAEWDDYLVALRQDAHQLLAWAYQDVRGDLPVAGDECDITDLLGFAMDQRINHQETPGRFMFYAIRLEHPVSSSKNRGKRRPKLDIQIVRCGRPQRYFTFEAKRLRDDKGASVSRSIRHYLGDEGVRRFLEGRYAGESLEAAMLGCIQARDAHFWIDRIESALVIDRQSGADALRIIEQLRRCKVIHDLQDEAVSLHSRMGLTPIRLFHIFLDCK